MVSSAKAYSREVRGAMLDEFVRDSIVQLVNGVKQGAVDQVEFSSDGNVESWTEP